MVLDSYRTLLLDNGYRPLSVLGWQRALLLGLTDRVDVVEYYEHVQVHSPSQSYPLPAVVRLRQYLRKLRRTMPYSRRNVFMRDEGICQYCGREPAWGKLTVDHVHPRCRGGGSSWDNVVTACGRCNTRKGGRTPEEANMPLLRVPTQPKLLREGRVAIKLKEIPSEWALYLAG